MITEDRHMKEILGFGLLRYFENNFKGLPFLFLTVPSSGFSVSITGEDS